MSKTKRRRPIIKPRETYIDTRELERMKNEAVKDAVSAMTEVLIACQISVMKKTLRMGQAGEITTSGRADFRGMAIF